MRENENKSVCFGKWKYFFLFPPEHQKKRESFFLEGFTVVFASRLKFFLVFEEYDIIHRIVCSADGLQQLFRLSDVHKII